MKSMTNKNKEILKFTWRITAAHTIAYFCAGIFALLVIDYKVWFSEGAISSFMLPTDTPIVALGPAFQIIRGLIMAIVLLPLRKVFIDGNFRAFGIFYFRSRYGFSRRIYLYKCSNY